MKKLTDLRKKSGLTISYLAKLLEVSSPCVCQWEKGKRVPSITEVPKLAKILNCSIEEVVLCFCDDN